MRETKFPSSSIEKIRHSGSLSSFANSVSRINRILRYNWLRDRALSFPLRITRPQLVVYKFYKHPAWFLSAYKPWKLVAYCLRRLERVFRCYIVCETKEDYKEGCLMVWANYMSPCDSIVGLYFKGTCDVISVTMATHKVHKSVF